MREATQDDAGDIAEVFASGMVEAWTAGQVRTALALPGTQGLVIERDGRMVAAALLLQAAEDVEVLQLAVWPSHRRRGLGSSLLRAALEQASARGARHAHLEVRAGNAAAQALYAGLGYAVSGRRHRYYQDGEDAVTMGRGLDLGPG